MMTRLLALLMLTISLALPAETWDETRFEYVPGTDLLARKTYPDGSAITYTYCLGGLPRRITQASGKWMERVYDGNCHMVSNLYSSSETPWVAVEPNALGTASRVEDGNGMVYDYHIRTRGQIVTNEAVSSSWMSWSLGHGYDIYSRDTGWTLSVGGIIKGGVWYGYDSNGQISSLSCTNANGRGFSVSYTNQAGYISGYVVALPSTSEFRRQMFRNAYRPHLVLRQDHSFAGSTLLSVSNAYDALDRMTSCTQSGVDGSDSFEYYRNGGIARAVVHGSLFCYAFDSAGNCTRFSAGSTTNSFLRNQLNQCYSILPLNGSVAVPHVYDQDGNLTHVGGLEKYRWDCENRLVEVLASGGAVTNTYDYEHRLVRQRLPGRVRLCVFDRWNLIYEKVVADGGATTETQYFWGPDCSGTLDGACGVGGLVAVSRNGSFYFPCYGRNSEIVAYVDEQGEIVASYRYGPFGEEVVSSGVMAESFSFRYMTKRWDAAVGLYDFGGRWYSPELKGWINRDPLGEDGGVNLYTFCENDPVNKFDPNGCIPLDTIWDLANVVYDICVGDDVALAADMAALVVPYVPAGASKLVKAAKLSKVTKVCPGAKTLKVTYKYMPARMYKGGKHTLPKAAAADSHWVKRTMRPNPGKFMPGWGDKEIKSLIEEAFQAAKKQGKVNPSQLDGFVYDTGRYVGASNGKMTKKIKIHVERDGTGLHAFPCP